MVANERRTLYSGAFGTRDSSGPPVGPDSIFAIASMTKPVTTVAALQLVEQGKLKLDAPVAAYLPQLDKLQVLEGFDSQTGKSILRAAQTPVTLKHLLTHTSGLCYDIWDAQMFRYASHAKTTGPEAPILMFEPGTRWQYGSGVDWAGRLVEAVSGMNLEEYFQARILGPLEMRDTSYLVPASKFARLVAGYSRQPDGSLKPNTRVPPRAPKEFSGGGGLYSTAGDYVRFMQMILGKGRASNNVRILEAGERGEHGDEPDWRRNRRQDEELPPGLFERCGYATGSRRKVGAWGFLINTTAYNGGRSARQPGMGRDLR